MNRVNDDTNLEDFFNSLAAGVQRKILENVLTKTAKGVLTHGAKGRKGKIIIEISMARLNDEDENLGLKVESKLSFQTPTKRGDSSENENRESVMYLTPTGLSDVPARIHDEDEGTGISLQALGMQPQGEQVFIPRG